MAITKSKTLKIDYFSYAKSFFNLMKPRVMSLVIFTCAVGLLIAPEKINFTDIPKYIEYVIDKHPYLSNPSLEDIYNLMDWIKDFLIKEIKI